MGKNKLPSLFVCVLLLVSLFAGCGGTDSATPAPSGGGAADGSGEETFHLKFAGTFPEEHIGTQYMYTIAEEVEAATGGTVTIEVFPASQLGDMNVVLQGMIDGSVDMAQGYVDSTYDSMLDLLGIGYLVKDFNELAYLHTPGSNYYRLYDETYARIGVKFLGFHAEGLVGVSCKVVPDNYNTLDAKSNVTIRNANSECIKMCLNDMGFSTVSIDWSDVYSSIQTGICDGSFGQTPVGVYNNFRDIVNYYIPYNAGMETLSYLISPVVWEKMSESQQAAVQEAVTRQAMIAIEDAEDLDAEGMRMLEEAGVEILPLTEQEVNAFAEHVRTVGWPKLYDIFGEDVMQMLAEDVENANK